MKHDAENVSIFSRALPNHDVRNAAKRYEPANWNVTDCLIDKKCRSYPKSCCRKEFMFNEFNITAENEYKNIELIS